MAEKEKKERSHKQTKSHKEAESVNFMTTLSFCQGGNRNPTNIAVIDRQKFSLLTIIT